MTQILEEKTESAIRKGIKNVGIGKKGSKNLDSQLISEILTELKSTKVPKISQGAFFAGLFFKGLTKDEKALQYYLTSNSILSAQHIVERIASDAPELVQQMCLDLLNGQELTKQQAYTLGKFLFSNHSGDGARGIVASALRVRYETPDEYEGLLLSMQETIEPPFLEKPPPGQPIIQMAEPFDGVDHSYLLTPLLANYLQKINYRVVNLVGRNSGPKFGNNLWDVTRNLDVEFLKANSDFHSQPTLGWYLDQKDLSKPMDHWVDLRHQTIKRPFLATLEKFLNPLKADILITSAFHPPYSEKMVTVGERAGFPAIMVVRNGLEGTLSFALKRAAKILCSVRQKDGSYLREEIGFDPTEYLDQAIPVEEKLILCSPKDNARLIEMYNQNKKTDNELFDIRVKISCLGLKKALDWIEERKKNDLG